MKSRIAQGDWSNDLPGERRIADTLQVGRDTVRLALQQLEKEGVISPAAKGTRRKVLIQQATDYDPSTHAIRVGLLSSKNLELLPQPTLLEVDRIRMALASLGGSLAVFSPSWFHSARPGKRLRELLKEEPCNAWILHRSSAAIQRSMEQTGTPCLIRGYPHEGITLPHLDIDWAAAGRHGAGALWRLGHRRVAVLTPPDALMGVQAAVHGISSLGEPGFEVVVAEEDGTAEGTAKVLNRVFRSNKPPTAVIASRPRQTVTALSWLNLQGLRVPEEVSLLSLGHEPFLDHLLPEISGYWTSPEMVARRLVRRIEVLCQGHGRSGGNPWINPDFRKGKSIGPVRTR
ncbi:substrate-binding domain-containing protein [Haloferula rosea]|uniref:Substrate-binding domain-containing protein n=1 Tax=Haloferula rosea TaxID=490093 RepID=A0A934RCS2_9BACT|nr:substrate-binding domain-containing protein [Haloferula rosea]MBK1826899.1 substrate-binding domain-containing protein [Haloferula rosea]